jgi:DNA-binding protein HU-beta
MTKKELIDEIALRCQTTKKDAGKFLNAALDIIMEEVANGRKVNIPKFGAYIRRLKNKRIVRNPKNGKISELDERTVVVFKPGKNFKNKVAGKPVEIN